MTRAYRENKSKYKNIVCTIVAVLLLSVIFIYMISYIYTNAEETGYDYLHVQTKQIKDDLQLQIRSDRENLSTMANFASKLYADGESYSIMFTSFNPIGLIANIGILNPDNTFVTKVGSLDLNGEMSFDEEAKKGEYISGRVKDVTNPEMEIIRSAVPIKNNGKVVGILYGVIKLDSLREKYAVMAEELEAQLYVYEKGNGNFVLDTFHKNLGNIIDLADMEYKKGFSYEQMVGSDRGYSSFMSKSTGEYLYLHYSPLEISDWQIMLARSESNVFANTHLISRALFGALGGILLVCMLYFFWLFNVEKRRNSATLYASQIRKLLLEINQEKSYIVEAMEKIVMFSNSRSAFFVDTDGEDYNYISPAFAEKLLTGAARQYLVTELFGYAAKIHRVRGTPVSVICIKANNHLKKNNHEFYTFLQDKGIFEISFAAVTDNRNNISILATVNPNKGQQTRTLLEDITVCFSIAIFNKKHLHKTENAAITDALTGLFNRVLYKKDLLRIDEEQPKLFSCVYIDVNELNICNNKYGHAAGDEMLIYIANTLREVFYGHKVYRLGGDEFLVFVENTPKEDVEKAVILLDEYLKPKNYHVAVGVAFRTQNNNTEEVVREAEKRMYEAKARYYQNKETYDVSPITEKKYEVISTGLREIDTLLSVMKEHYNGIYRVSLKTDEASRIIMPSYLGYNENEHNFSKLLSKYIQESVNPVFHRAMLSFLNYDALARQFSEGNIPRITYNKINREIVTLSVYKLDNKSDYTDETLWVFEKGN